MLNWNQEAEDTDAPTTSNTNNRSHSPLDDWESQTAMVMADKKDRNMTSEA